MGTPRRKHKNRKAKAAYRELLQNILKIVWYYVHWCIDCVIDLGFSFYYDDSNRKHIPRVTESFLMESAVSLAERIRNKEISSEVVVKGFIDRIRAVNPIINAVTSDRFELAVQEAREVDRTLASDVVNVEKLKEQKPFLGVPFTTKDSTAVEGLLHTLGLVSRRNTKATEDAEVVKLMKDAGAIVIAVTNIPEVNMWCETRNNVFGQTSNPYNPTRTVGGSSGGEGSLIAVSGSPLGIGTDIGGSIRMPAFFCGIFGHKPTNGLTSTKGLTRRTGLEKDTMVAAGPMCKYAQDLAPFLKVLVGTNISKLNLDAEVSLTSIKFLYMEESGDLHTSRVSSDMRQALHKAVNHFAGISKLPVEKVNFPEMNHSFRMWKYWMTKEPLNFAAELGNREEEVSACTEMPKKVLGRSDFTLAALLQLVDKQLIPPVNAKWAEELTSDLKEELLEKLGTTGVLLYISHPFPAPYHYSSYFRPFNCAYWAIFNVLKLPATQVPMGLNKDGLPVGIQVVAAPYQDHLCLAVAKELQQAFGGWVPPFPVEN